MRAKHIDSGAEQVARDRRFFDHRLPGQPDEVLGVETDALLRLGRSATALGVMKPETSLAIMALPDAVRVLPLVEQMQSDQGIGPAEVSKYRKPIKRMSTGLYAVDKAAAAASVIGVGIPVRRAINKRIEREFPVRAAEAVQNAREILTNAEQPVELVASFDNPKEQFTNEIEFLATSTRQAILQERDLRVRSGRVEQPMETPSGLAGFFVRVTRAIKSFFGFFSRKDQSTQVISEVTAYDAGRGINKTIQQILDKPEESKKRLPLLSGLVLERLPQVHLPKPENMALLAPEILDSLFSALPKDEESEDMLRSVLRNPHEFRFVTNIKKNYRIATEKRTYYPNMDRIRYAAVNLLPAIRDVLPSSGAQVKQSFDTLATLLRTEPIIKPDPRKIHKAPRAKLRNRLKQRRAERKKRQLAATP